MAVSRGSSKSPRSRFGRTPERRVVLTERDDDIACEVFKSRLLSRDHLIRLGYFGSISRANLVLRRLVDAGSVRRVFPALGSYGAQALYAVGPNATALVAARFGIEASEVVRLARKDPARLHIDHTVRVNDVRLMLHEAAAKESVGFRWVSEVFARHEYEVREGGTWKSRILKPDAFFTLTDAAGAASHFLLEVDLGHVGRPNWTRSIRQCEQHAALGLLPEAYGVEEARVLTITSGGTLRLRHLSEPVPEGSRRYMFATFTDIEEAGILGNSWRLSDGTRVSPLANGGPDVLV